MEYEIRRKMSTNELDGVVLPACDSSNEPGGSDLASASLPKRLAAINKRSDVFLARNDFMPLMIKERQLIRSCSGHIVVSSMFCCGPNESHRYGC